MTLCSNPPVSNAARSTAISLFAGAGGMDIGVDSAGFKTICAIESDPHCASTLRCNARRKTVWQADVRAVDPARLLQVLGVKPSELGLLHGGPPCQPFSQIGKLGGLEDPRGALVFELVRFARELRPAAVLIEQVPNFLRTRTAAGERLLEVLRDEFEQLGYDLPPPSSPDGHPLVANHVDVTPRRDQERIAYVPEGLWLAKAPNVPPDILRNLTRKDTTKFRRLHRDDISPTLRCGEALYHPKENRYITPREAARLQGFPDKHIFEGPIRRRTGRVPNLDQHRQVANAVPPPLAHSVAAQLRGALCL